MSLPDRTDRAHTLANSYATHEARDGWTRVQEYQRAMAWKGEHPDSGSSAASTALELPRSRIRAWFDGAKPDPAHAVATAEAHGWLDCQPGERTFEALALLHAWILAGGSISREVFVPHLSVGPDDPASLAHELFAAVGIDTALVNGDTDERATEVRPAGAGRSHLGRYLHAVMRAPVGAKNEQRDVPIPAWLTDSPSSTRRRWSQLYVTLRATAIDADRHGYARQLAEARSLAYRQGLAGVFRSVVADEATITVGSRALLLRASAADQLDQVPTLPE